MFEFTTDEALAAKIKSSQERNPLWADTPMKELRPFIERMQSELDKADRRMILDLAFRFAATISVVETARGHNEYGAGNFLETIGVTFLNRTAVARTRFNQAMWIAQRTGAVVLPTFNVLSEADMNRFWSRGILIIGFTGRTIRYDGTRGAFGFTNHDMSHIFQYIANRLNVSFDTFDLIGNGVSVERGLRDSLREFKHDRSRAERIEVPILSELDAYALEAALPHAFLRVRRTAVESMFFDLKHEEGVLVTIHPHRLLSRFENEIYGERSATNETLREKSRERADAAIWLAERCRTQGIDVPVLSRDQVILNLQESEKKEMSRRQNSPPPNNPDL